MKINNKKSNKGGIKTKTKSILIVFLIMIIILFGIIGASIIGIIQDAPEVNPSEINELMGQTSVIYDQDGNPIENIATSEYREIVEYDKIPEYLKDAFISIEDARFYKHNGVDPRGIFRAIYDNIRAGDTISGASTIAQQLSRNMYLSSEKKLDRKIKEAYIALKLTETMGRENVLEAYMNRVFLGQNAYGVQAASKLYFSKDVSELTLGQAATLAGIVKSPTNLALYRTIPVSEGVDPDLDLGEIEIGGEKYNAVFNQATLERQKFVLKRMLELGKITQEEYQDAVNEDIKSTVKLDEREKHNISSYYADLVEKQLIEKLMEELNYTEEDAKSKIANGGLKIYAAIDQDLQNDIENIYNNLTDTIFGGQGSSSRPIQLAWSGDSNGNITNSVGNVVYFKKENLLKDDNGVKKIYIPSGSYKVEENGDLIITSDRVKKYGDNLDIIDYFTVENRNLTTHTVSAIKIGDEQLEKIDNGVKISNEFLEARKTEGKDFYTIKDGNLFINPEYYSMDEKGVIQPQSSTVVIDHSTGLIKAIVGGRGQSGRRILNRASDMPRQPGSSIKPLATFTPALDNGYTAASGMDDIPHYNDLGELWPNNWYKSFKGLVSLRTSVEQSINVTTVKTLEDIGIQKSKEYLKKFGIINDKNANADYFVTEAENKDNNDENLASLGLGAMTKGVTNLEMTGAFAALANNGEYIEPLTFTKVLDSTGKVLLEDIQEKHKVVSPEVAYVMTDILKISVNYNYAREAKNSRFDVAGKTGTTQETQDLWFVGYTPYYTIGTWLGFDNQQLKLKDNSGQVVKLWNKINNRALADKVDDERDKRRFQEPEDIVHATVCTLSGKKPKKACYGDHRGVVKDEIFVKGTEPTEYCDVHFSNGYSTYIKRPKPYYPSRNNNIIPEDWYYSSPYPAKPKKTKPKKEEPKKDTNVNTNTNKEDTKPLDENNNTQNNTKPTEQNNNNQNNSQSNEQNNNQSNKPKPQNNTNN